MTKFTPASPHILLIDDRPDDLRLLVELLRGCDLRLSVAFDGAKGYDRALAALPDLILLDVYMPRRDGFSLARMLKANPFTAHIPILFLTAANGSREKLIGLREDAVDYITKPFFAEEVLERIYIHLRLSGVVKDNAGGLPFGKPIRLETSSSDVLVKAAKTYLVSRLGESLRLSELTRSLGVSERRLSNAFGECMGMTTFEYIRQERMRKAKRLLAETTLNIAIIAETVGFPNAANFSTAFRDYVGTSPSNFRRTAPLRFPIRPCKGALLSQ